MPKTVMRIAQQNTETLILLNHSDAVVAVTVAVTQIVSRRIYHRSARHRLFIYFFIGVSFLC